MLVFGFLFLSKQEESSYRRKDTEGRKRKTRGTGRAEFGKIAESQGGLQRAQSLCGCKRHTKDLRLQIMSLWIPQRKKGLKDRPASLFCEEVKSSGAGSVTAHQGSFLFSFLILEFGLHDYQILNLVVFTLGLYWGPCLCLKLPFPHSQNKHNYTDPSRPSSLSLLLCEASGHPCLTRGISPQDPIVLALPRWHWW